MDSGRIQTEESRLGPKARLRKNGGERMVTGPKAECRRVRGGGWQNRVAAVDDERSDRFESNLLVAVAFAMTQSGLVSC